MSGRIARACQGDDELASLVQELLRVSRQALPLMFAAQRRCFVHTVWGREEGRLEPRGTSLRYSAIVVLGARWLDPQAQRPLFGGESAADFCGRLIAMADGTRNLGDLALVSWAAAELRHPGLGHAIGRLLNLWKLSVNPHTVEVAWTLSALVAACGQCETSKHASAVRGTLAASIRREVGIFAHYADPARAPAFRRHQACFADQVYPIQALARYHGAFGSMESLELAEACADQICRLQGDAGQWWWHYDARTGGVLEGYPVYSVHQDAMGPMALLDLMEVGGRDRSAAIRRSLRWLVQAPEVGVTLVQREPPVIWRKVGRRDPFKLVRGLQSALGCIRPGLRAGGLDVLFPPTAIEYESRPYHLGWILHTWLGHVA